MFIRNLFHSRSEKAYFASQWSLILIQISLYLADILYMCLSSLFSLEHRVFFPNFYSSGVRQRASFFICLVAVCISFREESSSKMALLHHL